MSYNLLLREEYGLKSLKYVKETFEDVTKYTYISAKDINGNLAGTFRIERNYNVLQFTNLTHKTVEYCNAGNEVVDVGVYINKPDGQKANIFNGLFIALIRYLVDIGVHGIYAQVPKEKVNIYKKLGFEIASQPFTVNGWNHVWYAIFMNIKEPPINICKNMSNEWYYLLDKL
ncbi:MAG: hypothetical protein FJ264_16085 [Planctomycetes bacterium]|nr:hypothetical protein [Planctomycetota bacterium]